MSSVEKQHNRHLYYIAFAALIIACMAYFVVEYITAQAWPRPGYSYIHNYVSDLGVPLCTTTNRYVCSPLHNLINTSFFVIGGLSLFSMLIFSTLFSGVKRWVVSAMVVVQSTGIMMVGFAPGSFAEDITNDKLQMAIHSLGALFGILGTALLAIVVGMLVIRRARVFGSVSLLLGSIPLLSLLLQAITAIESLGLGRGGFERLGVYSVLLWFGVVGVWGIVSCMRNAIKANMFNQHE